MIFINGKNFTKKQILLFNEISINIQEEFNEFVKSIYSVNNSKSLAFLLNPVISRNPLQSQLFENICSLELIRKIKNEQEHLTCFVNSFYLKKILNETLLFNKSDIKLKFFILNIVFVKQSIDILKIIFFAIKNLLIVNRNRNDLFLKTKNIILIDSFLLKNSIIE